MRWLSRILWVILSAQTALVAQSKSPNPVSIGVYLNNADSIDLANNNYYLNAYLWFKWKGDFDPTKDINWLNLMDAWGLTQQPLSEKPRRLKDGRLYQRFYVEGKFFHKFWLGTFPLDWQKLTIEIESKRHLAKDLVFVPDPNSKIKPDLTIPGWEIVHVYNQEKKIRYPTNFGLSSEAPEYSHYRFGIRIQRSLRFYLLKILPPTIIVLFCCFLVFMVHASYVDVRIGTPVGVLLTEVFLYLSFIGPLPNVGILFLIDHIYNYCYFITFLVLLVCIYTTKLYDRMETLKDENPEAEQEIILLEKKISRADRFSLLGFPFLLLLGISLITLVVRGVEYF